MVFYGLQFSNCIELFSECFPCYAIIYSILSLNIVNKNVIAFGFRSSIPKPGSAAGAAPVQLTPSPPTSASGGNYLVRTFSTRARNMNYTPTKPYNEVSDSSATSTTSSNSQADAQSVETHEPSRGTNDPFGLTTQKYVPQSRPGSSRPGSGHPTGGNSHAGAGSRPDSATLFYHKESKNDRVMARTDVVRRPPPEQGESDVGW